MITHFYTQIHKIKPCFGWVWKNYLNACLPTFLSFDPFLFFEIIFLLRIEPRVAQKISKCLIGGRLKPRWWSKSCLCKSCSICFVRGRVRETIDWTLRENIQKMFNICRTETSCWLRLGEGPWHCGHARRRSTRCSQFESNSMYRHHISLIRPIKLKLMYSFYSTLLTF